MQKKAVFIVLNLLLIICIAFSLFACTPDQGVETPGQDTGTPDQGADDPNHGDDSKDDNNKHIHVLVPHQAKEPTCTMEGNIAYWSCECGKYFADAEGKTEIALSSTVRGKINHNYVGGVCSTCGDKEVVPPTPVTAIYLDKISISGEVGNTEAITATVIPSTATDKTLDWVSLNPSVATVDNGVVTLVGVGATKIIVSSTNGIVAECDVVVLENADFRFAEYGDGYAVVGYVGDSVTVTVPSTHGGKKVVAVGDDEMGYGFKNNTVITSVALPNTVQTINSEAFGGCNALTTVSGLDNVKIIGASAFQNCSNLTELNGIVSLTTIGSYAFEGCDKLNQFTLPDSMVALGDYAFSGCPLKKITIPNSVISVGAHAFHNCKTIEEAIVPMCAIGALSSLPIKSITVTNGTELPNKAFEGWSNLESVVLPDNLTSIGSNAFDSCEKLANIDLPNTVKIIEKEAFFGCMALAEVTLPENVSNVGRSAFAHCDNLLRVTILNSSINVDNTAFAYCYNVEWAKIPTVAIANIPQTNLQTVIIDGGDTIDYNAFYQCHELLSVTICDGVTSIGAYAFYACGQLSNLTIADTVTSIGTYAFYACRSLTSLTLPDGVKRIDHYTFYQCFDLESISLPRELQSIGNYAFYDCRKLTSITLPDNLMYIGANTFEECKALTSITVSASVTSISTDAFKSCNSLTEVHVVDIAAWCTTYFASGGNPLSYAHNLYVDNQLVTELEIPSGTEAISERAFLACYNLTSVTVPNSVKTIGSAAFGGCIDLESITIPFVGSSASATTPSASTLFGYIFGGYGYSENEVEAQQYYASPSQYPYSYATYGIPAKLKSVTVTGGELLFGAFYNCSSLTSITLADGVTAVGERALHACRGVTSVFIASSVNTIGRRALNLCNSLRKLVIPFLGESRQATSDRNMGYLFEGVSSDGSSIGLPNVLTDVVLTDCTAIGGSAFRGCTFIRRITIPSTVTSIGNYAFYTCSAFLNIFYCGTQEQWEQISIGNYNGYLDTSPRYYYSEEEPQLNADETDYDGNYWHYDIDGVTPVIWTKEN